MGTRVEIMSWIIVVSRSTLVLNLALESMESAGESRSRQDFRAMLNLSKSTLRKLCEGGGEVLERGSSISVTMGRWSALGGQMQGSVLQEMMGLRA